jgi:hypothetical protein
MSLVVNDFCFEIRVANREIGRRHYLGEHALHEFFVKRSPVHDDFRVFQKKGLEERKPHEVIPMAMRQEKVVLIAPFFDEMIAATPDAGARIDDDDIVTGGPNFKAGGIAAVLDILFPGDRYGAPCAPASNNHRSPSGLNGKAIPGFTPRGGRLFAILLGDTEVVIRCSRHEK